MILNESAVATEALISVARRAFHAGLLKSGVLGVNAAGVASNADVASKVSVSYAAQIAKALEVEVQSERLAGQTSGGKFEQHCADFLSATFPHLGMLRPGEWRVAKVGGRSGAAYAGQFEQYSHLIELHNAVKDDPHLQAVLGNAYTIAPDVVIARAPVADEFLNGANWVVDSRSALHASIRSRNQSRDLLHAVISCKWTIRSDRAQNSRSEALNLIRNRKGRAPHIAVVTGEPMPSRISSLALGTGDIDCVYHFALPELRDAVAAVGHDDAIELLETMVAGNRLRDIADLPLDLAI
ncbi:NgoMIV family type II restriction endonuclease [Curtobacterium herbarum]|uniref:NgoMIV family type II restriction endonuclease n=1 Tax=Curtobacterium herbarum TaxID=150122 RepID=UPI001C8E285C|nr:NgoMIV family type II restriction endonuclease [Curtobacterium herbarum]MBY0177797.1 restriction endonuclease [Curtobacterium herbarum]